MKRKAALLTALLLSVGLAGCGTEKDSSMEAPELLEPVDVKMDIATARTGDIYCLPITVRWFPIRRDFPLPWTAIWKQSMS